MTHPHAIAAIRAAKNRTRWGRWATYRYLSNRGVPTYLYALALNLEGGRYVQRG